MGRKHFVVSCLFAAGIVGAATPPSVPDWVDINSQISPRTGQASCSVPFVSSADGRTIDEETGGTWTLTTMQPGTYLIVR